MTAVPARAWAVTAAGTAVNLCLGILYGWSVWKAALVPQDKSLYGRPMDGLNEGWIYLSNTQGNWAFSVCGAVFALFMIPGGRLQDRYGAKLGATLGGLFLAVGCIVAGLMKSYAGLVIGFGVLGGIGMGLGYAAATPAAVKWFHSSRRGLIVGLVVAGYGAAAVYISPLADYLIRNHGLTGSFVGLGILFAVVVVVAGQLLNPPPAGYVAPAPTETKPQGAPAPRLERIDYTAKQMLRTWQFYALVLLFIGSAQSGLLVIANAKQLLTDAARLKITDKALKELQQEKVPNAVLDQLNALKDKELSREECQKEIEKVLTDEEAKQYLKPILNQAGKTGFFAENAWLLVTFIGVVNALGRVGTGRYSDRIGRLNAYALNGAVSGACLLVAPWVIAEKNVFLLFAIIGVMAWQYGGTLAVLPALTADYYGPKNMGLNYGLVFAGWGIAFFVPQVASAIKDATEKWDGAFYLSAGLLVAAVLVSRIIRKPVSAPPGA